MKEKIEFILTSSGMQLIKPTFFEGNQFSSNEYKFSGNESYDGNVFADKDDSLTKLGTPVFSDIILKYESENLELYLLPALITVNMSKNIVKTVVKGRSGTVKEFISDGDYEINIDGALFGEGNNYPLTDLKTLISLCKIPDALTVSSKYLGIFEVHKLVIQSYSIPQGYYINKQSFSLKCLSDATIELKFNSELK